MNINDLTIVYFIESYSQEKLIYLKHKDDSLNIFLVYSQINPKLFNKNVFITNKKYFSSVLTDIFFDIQTNYFIYLKAEERIPFISYNNDFILPYYTLIVNYHFKNESFLRNEIRLYNKSKILSDGIDNINLDDTSLNIIIHNYNSYYNDISEQNIKKHLYLIENNDYNSESIFYITDYNLKIFYENFEKLIQKEPCKKDLKFILDINTLIKIKDTLDKKSSEYLSIIINELIFYLKNESFSKINEMLIEIQDLFPNSISILLIETLLYSKDNKDIEVIKNLDKIIEINKNYYRYVLTSKTLLDYKIYYIKGLIYNKIGNLPLCINEFEKCLNITNNSELIKELRLFIEENKQKINELNFKCENCGNCCKYKSINITHNDIQTILDNKPNININDFVSFKILDKNNRDCDNINYHNNQVSMVFKKKINGECVFLENNKCSIHTFKPLICKTWPFTIRESDNQLMWSLHEKEFLRDYCKHTLEEGNNDALKLEEDIKKFKKDRIKFIETIYIWNYFNKDSHRDFLSFALNFSDKNIKEIEIQIKEKIKIFFEDKNIDILEYNPFFSSYFIKTINNFSFGIHIENHKEYIGHEFLEFMKKYLNAYSYVISNIPNTYITFYIEKDNLRYSIDLYIFNTLNEIKISSNSEIMSIKKHIQIIQSNDNQMVEYTITNLLNTLNYINDNFIANSISILNFNIIESVNNILFSLISILNKQNFELLKHNDYKVMSDKFNKFLLSDYSFTSYNKENLIKYLRNANETFINLYNLYQNSIKSN